jgi:hypothetical protein
LRASADTAMKPSPPRAFAMRTTADAAAATSSTFSPTRSPISTMRGRSLRRDFVA